MAFKDGDVVRINYTIRRNAEVFDTTLEQIAVKEGIFDERRKYKPVVAIIGQGNFFKKVDEELKGMNAGEKKVVKLEPKDAFGERRSELVSVVALKEFKRRKITPFPGLVIDLNGMQGKVQSVSGGRVRVDFNHPLAGQSIEFELEVLEKIEAEEKKAEALVERYFGDLGGLKVKIEGKKLILEGPSSKLMNTDAQRAEFAKAAFICLDVNEVAVAEVFSREVNEAKRSDSGESKAIEKERSVEKGKK